MVVSWPAFHVMACSVLTNCWVRIQLETKEKRGVGVGIEI